MLHKDGHRSARSRRRRRQAAKQASIARDPKTVPGERLATTEGMEEIGERAGARTQDLQIKS